MNRKMFCKKICIVGICAVLGLGSSMEVMAAETVKHMMQAAGAGILISRTKTAEEYIEIAQEAKGASWGYTNLGLADVESGNLNIRENPSTTGKLVGKLPQNAACEVLDVTDGWAKITSGEVSGYVSAEFLLMGPDAVLKARELVKTVAKVTSDGVNVRDGASLESSVLTQVPKGEELEYIESLDQWVKVSIDGMEAYVSADYVKVETTLHTAITMTELLYGMGVSDVRVDLVEYAKQFLGNPYVWGGTSLTKGADCSGFVQSVFKKFGIKLSRTSRSQAKDGKKISTSDLKPGDLLFYADSTGTINHVALYIGGGQVIHASNPKSGIKISKYNYRTPVKCVRVIND